MIKNWQKNLKKRSGKKILKKDLAKEQPDLIYTCIIHASLFIRKKK
jgi:hypothetical protein